MNEKSRIAAALSVWWAVLTPPPSLAKSVFQLALIPKCEKCLLYARVIKMFLSIASDAIVSERVVRHAAIFFAAEIDFD